MTYISAASQDAVKDGAIHRIKAQTLLHLVQLQDVCIVLKPSSFRKTLALLVVDPALLLWCFFLFLMHDAGHQPTDAFAAPLILAISSNQEQPILQVLCLPSQLNTHINVP